MTARTSFEYELKVLKEDLLEMSDLVGEAMDKVVFVFGEMDKAVAEEIMKGDRSINDMERSIEARCLSLILRQQPVARDLRIVSAALKMVTDLERIGDQASDISEIILRADGAEYLKSGNILKMAKVARDMVKDVRIALEKRDLELTKQITARDDIVDDLFNQVKADAIKLFQTENEQTDHGIDLLMIGKYLERIADHAVNVCEWIEFNQTGAVNSVRLL